MTLRNHALMLLIVNCITMSTCLGQNSDDQDDEYVFTIPRLASSNPPHVMITTTSEDPVVATLSIPGYVLPINRTITRNNGTDIELPVGIKMNPGDGKQNKTVIVRALDVVSVYVIDNDRENGDAFQCTPSSKLGTKYSVATYEPNKSYSSFVCVSALHSSTTVTISNATDIIHSFTLHQYESFRYDGDGTDDLSGLLVRSTKPIAVIAGSALFVPIVGGTVGMVSQLTPIDTWGTQYFLFPFQSLNSGFVYKVSSFNISTILTICDGPIFQVRIEPGEVYEVDVPLDSEISLRADHPVMVAQFMKASNPNVLNLYRGGPSMLIVPPVASYTNHVRFPVFEYFFSVGRLSGHTYYINVVTQCDNIIGLFYDETISVASWDRLVTFGRSVCCARRSVSTGYHSVTHVNPNVTFFVSVYAICYNCPSSYAYTAIGTAESAQYPKPMVTTDIPNQTKQAVSFGCPQLTTLDNGLIQPNDTIYNVGQIVTAYCRRGFDLIGDERLVCKDTGAWHGQIPTCIQRKTGTSCSVIIISASASGVVLIALILIPITCCCRKRGKLSRDSPKHNSRQNLPRPHAAPVIKDSSEIVNPNTDSIDADNKGYETTRDTSAYRDLELSTITSSEQDYHGLYAQAK